MMSCGTTGRGRRHRDRKSRGYPANPAVSPRYSLYGARYSYCRNSLACGLLVKRSTSPSQVRWLPVLWAILPMSEGT